MKLCGCQESCFVDGEKAWGHYGGEMCLHLSERKGEQGDVCICLVTGEDVSTHPHRYKKSLETSFNLMKGDYLDLLLIVMKEMDKEIKIKRREWEKQGGREGQVDRSNYLDGFYHAANIVSEVYKKAEAYKQNMQISLK